MLSKIVKTHKCYVFQIIVMVNNKPTCNKKQG